MKALKMSSSVLVVSVGLFSILFLFNTLFHFSEYLWNLRTILFLIALPTIYITATLISFLKSEEARLNLALITVFSVIALYVAEFCLIVAGPHVGMPGSFDRRSKTDVIKDLRARGSNAFPSIHPKHFIPEPITVGAKASVPLAGIPRATTVFCNEIGTYYVYDSDELGFTNPPGLYAPGLQLALIGDSFTQGFCAPDGGSFAEQLRQTVPRTLNLGNNGNGPILELATIKEVLTPLRPRNVFWFYYEGNDIEDFTHELVHPVLGLYLKNPQFSQHIMERIALYDQALRVYAEKNLSDELGATSANRLVSEFPEKFRLWSRLWHLRKLLGLIDLKRAWVLHRWNHAVSEQELLNDLSDTLNQAKKEVESWDGNFVFVYLPAYRTYAYNEIHPWRKSVMELVQKHDIKSIDLLPVFASNPDPVSLYNFRSDAHYTTQGNALVAQSVLHYIKSNGLLPSKEGKITVALDKISVPAL